VENAVPVASDSVIIPTSGVAQYPILNVDGVAHSLVIQSGASIAFGTFNITVGAHVVHNGTMTTTSGVLTLNSATNSSMSGTGAYMNLTINKSGGASVNLASHVTVAGALTLTNGLVNTGADTLSISSTGSVARTNGYAVGNLRKFIATGATAKTFEIGDATNYTPVSVSFASVTVAGNLTAKVTTGDHPDIGTSSINAARNVNRYWTVSKDAALTFTTYSATFTFVAGDIDAGADWNNFYIGKKDGSWSQPTVGARTATSTQATGMTSFSDFVVGEPLITVNAKVFLEGPFSGSSMNTTLNTSGYLPLGQPYSGAPWSYSGTESVVSIPSDVVDWVLVELRTGTSAATKVGTRAAFVKSDGSVVELDGTSPVSFPGLSAGNYYVVLKHRNHLAVMSASAVALSGSSALYDFTTGTSQYYGSDAKNLGGGKFGMYAGDGSSDGFVDSDDFNETDNNLFQSGYRKSDLNMDGFVDGDDFNETDNNLFMGTNVPN
jgi:hypothetical protein